MTGPEERTAAAPDALPRATTLESAMDSEALHFVATTTRRVDPGEKISDHPTLSSVPHSHARGAGGRPDRGSRSPGRLIGEDTLLSLPPPADRAELEVGDRLSVLEDKFETLVERLRALERAPAPAPAPAPERSGSWQLWVIFLLALALAWQVLRG